MLEFLETNSILMMIKASNFGLLKKYHAYKMVWLANLFSGLAIWIQNVATSTYVSHLTTSAFLISLVQTSLTLPVFIFSLVAGYIADKAYAYKTFTAIQFGMSIIAISFALLTAIHITHVYLFLLLTLAIGVFYTLRLSIGQACITKTIPDTEIKQAAILNNMGFNFSRCIGPLIAGLLYTNLSTISPFITASLLFILSGYILYKTRLNKGINTHVTINQSIQLSFIKTISTLKQNKVFIRISTCSLLFFFFTSGFWGLLPYIARYHLNMSSAGLGYLTAGVGIGAIISGLVLPFFRNSFELKKLILSMFMLAGFSLFLSVSAANLLFVFISSICFGASWSGTIAILNGEIQSCVPSAYRGKTISLYFLIMYFGLFTGSLSTGYLSSIINTTFAIKTCGVCLIILGMIFYFIIEHPNSKAI